MAIRNFGIAAQHRSILGEGPMWSAHENAVYWVDMKAPSLCRLCLTDGAQTIWPMPDLIGWVIERQGEPGVLVGLRHGIAVFDPLSGIAVPVAVLDSKINHRLNDAKVDPTGRLWVGTMPDDAATPTGALYRVCADLVPVAVDQGYYVSNGPTFSPDGATLYHADSVRRIVYQFSIGANGALSEKRTFVTFPDAWGLPDGMTTDSEGGVWIGHWDGGRLSRFDPDGALIQSWTLPASRITSCAFGGVALDRLFITSAALDCPHEPLAGALFEIDPGVKGLAPTPFRG